MKAKGFHRPLRRGPVRSALTLLVGGVLLGCGSDGGGAQTVITGSTTVAAASSPATTTTTTGPSTSSGPLVAEDPPWTEQALQLEEIARLGSPIALVGRSGTSDLYVAEKSGLVQRIAVISGQPHRYEVDPRPLLDISSAVSSGNEQGLLDITFSNDGENLYVSYTDADGDNVIDRYSMSDTSVVTESRTEILQVDQPFSNHNGGGLMFGPDGFLYVGLGDGGRAGDPLGSGQDPASWLGSILRIDPTGSNDGRNYSIPKGNPFGDDGGAPEVWLKGVRNPWRFSFDTAGGDLWVADVGQNRFEEVNILPASTGWGRGANLGWNEMEAFEPFEGGSEPADHTPPLLAYAHNDGRCSVTGGYVYRGAELADFEGVYIFGDYCSGEVFGAQPHAGGVVFRTLNLTVGANTLGSFGLDDDGELYLMGLDGGVYRIRSAPPS